MSIRYFLGFGRKIKKRVVRRRIKIIRTKIRIGPKKLLSHLSMRDFRVSKDRALIFAKERVAHFNQFYNFEVGRITIRNQRTRWGSCSSKKNLSFNYKILFLPQDLAGYIIVHELCHLKEMNHSARFWNLVAEQVPDHKIKRQQMKLY